MQMAYTGSSGRQMATTKKHMAQTGLANGTARQTACSDGPVATTNRLMAQTGSSRQTGSRLRQTAQMRRRSQQTGKWLKQVRHRKRCMPVFTNKGNVLFPLPFQASFAKQRTCSASVRGLCSSEADGCLQKTWNCTHQLQNCA